MRLGWQGAELYRIATNLMTSAAFYQCFHRVAESGWSTDGVATTETIYDEATNTFHVVCLSEHLTSFCVLVDTTGEQVS